MLLTTDIVISLCSLFWAPFPHLERGGFFSWCPWLLGALLLNRKTSTAISSTLEYPAPAPAPAATAIRFPSPHIPARTTGVSILVPAAEAVTHALFWSQEKEAKMRVPARGSRKLARNSLPCPVTVSSSSFCRRPLPFRCQKEEQPWLLLVPQPSFLCSWLEGVQLRPTYHQVLSALSTARLQTDRMAPRQTERSPVVSVTLLGWQCLLALLTLI